MVTCARASTVPTAEDGDSACSLAWMRTRLHRRSAASQIMRTPWRLRALRFSSSLRIGCVGRTQHANRSHSFQADWACPRAGKSFDSASRSCSFVGASTWQSRRWAYVGIALLAGHYGAWLSLPLLTLPFGLAAERAVWTARDREALIPWTPRSGFLAMAYAALVALGLAVS